MFSKRGCALVSAFILLALAGGSAVVIYRLNTQYGLFEAGAHAEEEFANPSTRLMASLRLRDIESYVLDVMPPLTESAPALAWLPWSEAELLSLAVPHKLALIAGTDYRAGELRFSLLINERRGGPFIRQLIEVSGAFDQPGPVKWNDPPLTFEGRGKLLVRGGLALPEDLESRVLEIWRPSPATGRLALEGDHFLEAILDNQDGELFVLLNVYAEFLGEDLESLMGSDQNMEILFSVVTGIRTIRVSADLSNPDLLNARIEIAADQGTGAQLEFFAGLLLPSAKAQLHSDYGIVLDGAIEWKPENELLEGQFRLSQFRELLLQELRAAMAPGAGSTS